MFSKLILCFLLISYSKEAVRINHDYARLRDGKSFCEDKLNITYFDFHKYNRTTKALSVNFTLFQDVTYEDDLEIKSTFYIWKNNNYKKTPIIWIMHTCNFLDKDNFGIQLLMKDSTVKKCPLKKGKHYIKNISPPDLNGWPSVIPEGRWKLLIEYSLQKTFCMAVEWIAEVIKN